MRGRVVGIVLLALCVACTGGSDAANGPVLSPVQAWLRTSPMEIAHRGGDLDWPEGTAEAYRHAAGWSPSLALEVPVWRTADGVWVVSENRTTGRVFDGNYDIPSTPWSVLARLRTRNGRQPMARLVQDVLEVYGRDRILFVDDKADNDATAFLDVLDSYGGRSRFVVKSFWKATKAAQEAHRRGYLTWGYYFLDGMAEFAATQSKFDLLGLPYDAPSSDFRTMQATGKPVIAHIIASAEQAREALKKGARGLMISDVTAVVPQERGGG
jgi:glycerophosphoryl diester phosphodiesterase